MQEIYKAGYHHGSTFFCGLRKAGGSELRSQGAGNWLPTADRYRSTAEEKGATGYPQQTGSTAEEKGATGIPQQTGSTAEEKGVSVATHSRRVV